LVFKVLLEEVGFTIILEFKSKVVEALALPLSGVFEALSR